MRFIYSRFLAAATLTLLVLPQLTWAWTKDYSYEHKMGDNDSRNLAKEAAVEQIKLKAAQEAGTYIQGTTTLSNGQLEETITQIGASIVKVVVQSDKISVDDTGHQLLTVTANATVDETVMQERIKALREDANKAKLLQQLASENEKLRAEMTALAKQRVQELDSDKLAAIVVREVTLRKDLAANFTSTEQVFTSVVTAIDIANQEAYARKQQAEKEALARKNEFDKIAAEWDLRFFQPLRKPKILKAEVVDMRLSDSGRYYSGRIIIDWQDDPNKEVEQFLCQQNSNICRENKTLVFAAPVSIPQEFYNYPIYILAYDRVPDSFALYYIKYSLGGNTYFEPKRLIKGKYCYRKECNLYSLDIEINHLEQNFSINVDSMKNNPLLKVKVVAKEP